MSKTGGGATCSPLGATGSAFFMPVTCIVGKSLAETNMIYRLSIFIFSVLVATIATVCILACTRYYCKPMLAQRKKNYPHMSLFNTKAKYAYCKIRPHHLSTYRN